MRTQSLGEANPEIRDPDRARYRCLRTDAFTGPESAYPAYLARAGARGFRLGCGHAWDGSGDGFPAAEPK